MPHPLLSSDSQPSPGRAVIAAVVGVPVIVVLMLLAFLTPLINSGPSGLPLAVTGPEPVVAQVNAQLDTMQPGTFDTSIEKSPEAVTAAVQKRAAIGGLSLSPEGVTITTAGGAGSPYAALLTGLATALESAGQQVQIIDIAPMPADDPQGAGVSAVALPLVFGGMITGILLAFLARGKRGLQIGAAALGTLVVGFAAVAILQFGFGSVDGNYVLTSVTLALGLAAISFFVLGVASSLRVPGLVLAVLLMMFVANPLSGMATGWQWLPEPWGLIGQWLPVGAAGSALRSVAFFDGGGATFPLLVLTGWIVLGIALLALPARTSKSPA